MGRITKMNSTKKIRESIFFKSLSDEVFTKVINQSVKENIRKNKYIYNQYEISNDLYFVLDGTVGIYRENSNGTYTFIKKISEGNHFGEISFIDDHPREFSAKAEDNVSLFKIPKKSFVNIYQEIEFDTFMQISSFLTQQLRLNYHSEIVQEPRISKENAYLKFYKLYKKNEIKNFWEISQERLSQELKISRTTLSKIINTLENENVLKKVRGGLLIKDIELEEWGRKNEIDL
jgi:CRP-like cAMP-binding protein